MKKDEKSNQITVNAFARPNNVITNIISFIKLAAQKLFS